MKKYKRYEESGRVTSYDDLIVGDKLRIDDFSGNIYEGEVIKKYIEKGYGGLNKMVDVLVTKIIKKAGGVNTPVKKGLINSLSINKNSLKMKDILKI